MDEVLDLSQKKKNYTNNGSRALDLQTGFPGGRVDLNNNDLDNSCMDQNLLADTTQEDPLDLSGKPAQGISNNSLNQSDDSGISTSSFLQQPTQPTRRRTVDQPVTNIIPFTDTRQTTDYNNHYHPRDKHDSSGSEGSISSGSKQPHKQATDIIHHYNPFKPDTVVGSSSGSSSVMFVPVIMKSDDSGFCSPTTGFPLPREAHCGHHAITSPDYGYIPRYSSTPLNEGPSHPRQNLDDSFTNSSIYGNVTPQLKHSKRRYSEPPHTDVVPTNKPKAQETGYHPNEPATSTSSVGRNESMKSTINANDDPYSSAAIGNDNSGYNTIPAHNNYSSSSSLMKNNPPFVNPPDPLPQQQQGLNIGVLMSYPALNLCSGLAANRSLATTTTQNNYAQNFVTEAYDSFANIAAYPYIQSTSNNSGGLVETENIGDSAVNSATSFLSASIHYPNPYNRKNLNFIATKILHDWYAANIHYPYPSNDEVQRLAAAGHVTEAQVRKWLANRRLRTGNTYRYNNIRRGKRERKYVSELLRYNQHAFLGAGFNQDAGQGIHSSSQINASAASLASIQIPNLQVDSLRSAYGTMTNMDMSAAATATTTVKAETVSKPESNE